MLNLYSDFTVILYSVSIKMSATYLLSQYDSFYCIIQHFFFFFDFRYPKNQWLCSFILTEKAAAVNTF